MGRKKKQQVKAGQVGDMALLLEVASIVSYAGPLNTEEIAERLHTREVDFSVEQLHKLLHMDAASYFGIRKLNDRSFIMIIKTVPTQPLILKPILVPIQRGTFGAIHEMPMDKKPRQPEVKAAKRQALIDFCKTNKRYPSQAVEAEKSLYNFIQNNRADKDLMAQIAPFKPKLGRQSSYGDDTKLGIQLADSGGSGF